MQFNVEDFRRAQGSDRKKGEMKDELLWKTLTSWIQKNCTESGNQIGAIMFDGTGMNTNNTKYA